MAHRVRLAAAPIAWVAGIAFVIGAMPPLVLGIPGGQESDCGTVFNDNWRYELSYCHDRMVTWIVSDLGIMLICLAATGLWWVAYRRDTYRPSWEL